MYDAAGFHHQVTCRSATDRAFEQAFDLRGALSDVCDRVHHVLGWPVALLFLDDEDSGSCCVVGCAGLDPRLAEFLAGAAIGQTRTVFECLRDEPKTSESYALGAL